MRRFDPIPILQSSLEGLSSRGAILGVSVNGKVDTYSAGCVANEDHDRPFYIYSITKSFTAVAIMKLCEEHGDFLDIPFSQFLPDAQIPPAVTVRQMLNHTSGLSDYFTSPEYRRALNENPAQPWAYEKLMTLGLQNTPLFEAGNGWSYSNPAYALLDELIAEKSGMDAHDYVESVIVNQISLENTRPFLKADEGLELLEGDHDSFKGDFRPQYQPG